VRGLVSFKCLQSCNYCVLHFVCSHICTLNQYSFICRLPKTLQRLRIVTSNNWDLTSISLRYSECQNSSWSYIHHFV
jgi:hypothetical protein